MTDGRADLTLGKGHLDVRVADAVLDANAPSLRASLRGSFTAGSLAEPASYVEGPLSLAKPTTRPLGDSLSGKFDAEFAEGALTFRAWGAAASSNRPANERPDAEPGSFTTKWTWYRSSGQLVGAAAAHNPAGSASFTLQAGDQPLAAKLAIGVDDANWFNRNVVSAISGHKLNLDGRCWLRASLHQDADNALLKIDLDAKDLAFSASGLPFAKPRGDKLSFTATGKLTDTARGPSVSFDSVEAALGPINWRGRVVFDPAAAPKAQGSGVLGLVIGPELTRLLPAMQPMVLAAGLSGPVEMGLSAGWDGQRFTGKLELDATSLALHPLATNAVQKNAGTPATLKADLDFNPALHVLELDDLGAILGPIATQANAVVHMPQATGANGSVMPCATGRFTVSIDDAAKLPDLSPLLAQFSPSGRLAAGGSFSGDPTGLRLETLSLNLDYLAAKSCGQDVEASGAIEIKDIAAKLRPLRPALLPLPCFPAPKGLPQLVNIGQVRCHGLQLTAAGQQATVLFDLHDLLQKPTGRGTLLADRIDYKALESLRICTPPPPVDEHYHQRMLDQVRCLLASAVAPLAHADLDFTTQIAFLGDWLDPRTNLRSDVQEVASHTRIADGKVAFDLTCGANGGTFILKASSDVTRPHPSVLVQNHVRDMTGTEALNGEVAELFPDCYVTGTLWRDEQFIVPLDEIVVELLDPRLPSHPVGAGYAHMHQGVVRGRAAPMWIANLIPAFKDMPYYYDDMHIFSQYLADGTAVNDMVFRGSGYDIYIEGKTSPNCAGQYEIGTIAMGDSQSPQYNHRYHQGRWPLLRFKACLEHGHKVGEEVSYLWPHQTLYQVLVKNNLFYRMWLQKHEK